MNPTFTGFDAHDFATFSISGLAERMEAIQQRIQPKFRALGTELADFLSIELQKEMFLHIAKHARRTVNPPKDTWLAISDNKRGYKQHPHFQVGLFDDHLFVWFAVIYEAPNKSAMADRLLSHIEEVHAALPEHYVLSLDHMQKGAQPLAELGIDEFSSALTRFKDVKKAELLLGRHFAANDPLIANGSALLQHLKETYQTLLPIYRIAVSH